jgi:hypothetical protein
LSGEDGSSGDDSSAGLALRDYLALFIAALETVGLPILVFMAVVIVLVFVAKFVR